MDKEQTMTFLDLITIWLLVVGGNLLAPGIFELIKQGEKSDD